MTSSFLGNGGNHWAHQTLAQMASGWRFDQLKLDSVGIDQPMDTVKQLINDSF